MDLSLKTPGELQALLGERVRRLRISRDADQRGTAERAGISEKALRNLEAGNGSSVETLLRVLKALNALDAIDRLIPEPTINPVALLRHARVRQRVRRSRSSKD